MTMEKIEIDEGRDESGKFTERNPFGFKPGTSGNPAGRPKGSKSGSAVLKGMARQMLDPKTGLSAIELICAKLLSQAMDGNLAAIEMFFNRIEGRPGTRVEVPEENWQELAELHGLSEEDVINEARKLIESGLNPSDENADQSA